MYWTDVIILWNGALLNLNCSSSCRQNFSFLRDFRVSNHKLSLIYYGEEPSGMARVAYSVWSHTGLPRTRAHRSLSSSLLTKQAALKGVYITRMSRTCPLTVRIEPPIGLEYSKREKEIFLQKESCLKMGMADNREMIWEVSVGSWHITHSARNSFFFPHKIHV